MELTDKTSTDIYRVIVRVISLSVKYNNTSLFIRLYQFTKYYSNVDIFDILEKHNTNIFKLCIQYNSYNLLIHYYTYYNLDIDKFKKQCSNQELKLIESCINILQSQQKQQCPEYDKSIEELLMIKLFISVLYDLPYNTIEIVYNMYNYFNKEEYPDIFLNSQLSLLFMKKIYRESSLQFLINYKYLTITDIVKNYSLYEENGIKYNLTIFDFIYYNYLQFKIEDNYNKNSNIRESIKYIIIELYKIKYNPEENYNGLYKKQLTHLLITYLENQVEVSIVSKSSTIQLSDKQLQKDTDITLQEVDLMIFTLDSFDNLI